MTTRASKEAKKSMTEDIEDQTSPGIALLFSEVDENCAQEICTWILNENLSPNPSEFLTLMVNSPGGSLSDAFAIVEVMNGSRIPVRTVALGQACSAGLLIAMSGHKGMRIVTPTCSILSHHFSAGASGDYHSLLNIQKEYKFTDTRIIDQYKRCTGLDEKTIRTKLLPSKDVYLSPKEAVAFNLFDEIRGLGELRK